MSVFLVEGKQEADINTMTKVINVLNTFIPAPYSILPPKGVRPAPYALCGVPVVEHPDESDED